MLVVALFGAACRSSFDGADSETSTSSGTGSEGAAACEGDRQCVAAAPSGWDGPGWLAQGASPDACPSELPTMHDAYSEIEADPAGCECECEPAAADCGALRIDAVEPPCQGAQGSSLLPMAEQCVELGFVAGPVRAEFPDPQPAAGCTPTAQVDRPDPGWGLTHRLCVGDTEPADCDAGTVCAPSASGDASRLCVRRSGNHTCPPEYPVEVPAFAGYEDGRDCSCGCEAPLAVTCTALVDLYDEADCSGAELATLQTGDPNCTDGDAATHARSRAPVTGGGECTPSGPGEPTGAVSPADPVTICCQT